MLEIGEPDFPTAPHICGGQHPLLSGRVDKITHSLGLPGLREALPDYNNSKFNTELMPGQIVITSGTSPALP